MENADLWTNFKPGVEMWPITRMRSRKLAKMAQNAIHLPNFHVL